MLIVTGALIAFVLFTMVGNTVRSLQGVGWLPIHPIDIDIPLWMGTWLGDPSDVGDAGAQVLAVAFVIGSYWAAELVPQEQVPPSRVAPGRTRGQWQHHPATVGAPALNDPGSNWRAMFETATTRALAVVRRNSHWSATGESTSSQRPSGDQ